MQLVQGTEIHNRYRLVAHHRTGGAGALWKAQRLSDGKPFAIKFLRRELTARTEIVQRFFQEASILRGLQHLNVVGFHEAETFEGVPYLVFEWLDGKTLEEHLNSYRQHGVYPSLASLGWIFLALCEGTSAVHAQGIVHRDLTPDNVLLSNQPDGAPQVKIVDFGVARIGAGGGTQMGAVFGKPGYIPPEQAQGLQGDLTAAADVYAIAVMLLEALTLEIPQLGWGERMRARLAHGDAELPPTITAPLVSVLARALAPDPHTTAGFGDPPPGRPPRGVPRGERERRSGPGRADPACAPSLPVGDGGARLP